MLFNRGWFSSFMVFFGYMMAVIYIGIGCVLLITKLFPAIPWNLKFTFALFFIAYGSFRLVKMITKKPESNE